MCPKDTCFCTSYDYLIMGGDRFLIRYSSLKCFFKNIWLIENVPSSQTCVLTKLRKYHRSQISSLGISFCFVVFSELILAPHSWKILFTKSYLLRCCLYFFSWFFLICCCFLFSLLVLAPARAWCCDFMCLIFSVGKSFNVRGKCWKFDLLNRLLRSFFTFQNFSISVILGDKWTALFVARVFFFFFCSARGMNARRKHLKFYWLNRPLRSFCTFQNFHRSFPCLARFFCWILLKNPIALAFLATFSF